RYPDGQAGCGSSQAGARARGARGQCAWLVQGSARPSRGRHLDGETVDGDQRQGSQPDRPIGAEPFAAMIGPDLAPSLEFTVEGAEALEYAAVPTLRFMLRLESAGGAQVASVVLNAQVRIAVRARQYDAA